MLLTSYPSQHWQREDVTEEGHVRILLGFGMCIVIFHNSPLFIVCSSFEIVQRIYLYKQNRRPDLLNGCVSGAS